jgi:hypothetical protein
LLCQRPRESRMDALRPEFLIRYTRFGHFIPNRLQEQVLDAPEIKNRCVYRTGLLVVDYVGEKSNLNLSQYFLKIIELFPEKEV